MEATSAESVCPSGVLPPHTMSVLLGRTAARQCCRFTFIQLITFQERVVASYYLKSEVESETLDEVAPPTASSWP